jgi:hypothetical protein
MEFDQMAIQYTYQHLLLLGPTKLTQIEIFGLKIYHLATPVLTVLGLFYGAALKTEWQRQGDRIV